MGQGYTGQYLQTIGADFAVKEFQHNSSSNSSYTMKCQIWDLAGQDRFLSVRELYYRGAHGVLLLYDCTDQRSFENVHTWMKEIRSNLHEHIPIVLIANKIDLREQNPSAIGTVQGEEMAKVLGKEYFDDQYTVPYIETSAKTGEHVELAFDQLIQQILNMNKLS